MLIAARRLYDQLYDPWRVAVVRGRTTPPGEIIGRGGDIYVGGSHTDEVLCAKCYITDIIDIIPSGWLA